MPTPRTPHARATLRHARGRPRHSAPRRSHRYWFWLAPTLLLIVAVAWIGARGWLAKTALEEAQADVGLLKAEAAAMNLPAIEPIYDRVAERTATARQLTTDPVWRVAEWMPFLGRNLTVVRELAESTDDVMIAVEPLVSLATELDPASLAPQDGAIPLDVFVRAGPLVEDAAVRIDAVNERAAAIDAGGTLGPVANARDRFVELLGDVQPSLDSAAELVPMIPALLGADAPRTYIVMFQNNAEARSLGGTALSFARITIDAGKINLEESVPAGFGNFPPFSVSPVPVPAGFSEIYPAAFGIFIPNATLRPSYPSAAEIVYQNWLQRKGVAADAVISIDAVALSYLLRATGPVTLSTGDVIDANNAVSFLLNDVLRSYQTGNVYEDNELQDRVYSETVTQTFARLSTGGFDVPTMASAMLQAFAEQRMALWSAHPEEQERVQSAGMANDLPESTPTSNAIGLYVNDNVGSKLNYYLAASASTHSAVCTADGRQVHRIVAVLTNLIDPALARTLGPSILGDYARYGLAPGEQRIMLFGYAPPGSTILGATVDGQPIELEALHDEDHPVARFVISPKPGEIVQVTLDILMAEPGIRQVDLRMTPLVHPVVELSTKELDCSTLTLPAG